MERFPANGLKVPQTGWNELLIEAPNPLLADIDSGAYAYFNHSYYCNASDPEDVIARVDYGILYPGVEGRGNLLGVQFHPEKSQSVGLQILQNFVEAL